MALHVPKPLPTILSSPLLRRLTLDANTLISTLIQRAIDQEGLDSQWADGIKDALADFGEYAELSQVLVGIKVARRAQSRTRESAGATPRENQRKEQDRLKESKGGKGKGNEGMKESEVVESESLASSHQTNVKLGQIHHLTSSHTHPVPLNSPKHLLLTVSPFSTTSTHPDASFDITHSHKTCIFNAEFYSLPFYNVEQVEHGDGGTVICGLDNWNLDDFETSPRIVGGLFTFQNLTSAAVHEHLTKILKLSVYTYLSLILEQHLLSDFHITLQYPVPTPRIPPRSPTTSFSPTILNQPSKQKPRSTKSSSGIWSFLSKKTGGIIHRVTGTMEATDGTFPRSTSLDISSVFSSSKMDVRSPRTSEESPRPVFTAEDTERLNTIKATQPRFVEEAERRDRERFGPFTSTVQRVRDQQCILSTSPKVVFPPPSLITRLAQREEESRYDGLAPSSAESSLASSTSSMTIGPRGDPRAAPALKLTGIERTGLGSVLGWEGREARGRGMAGIRSFIRHQSLTVLYAEHIEAEDSGDLHPCGRPRWMTIRYWARTPAADSECDQTFGEVVERLCSAAAAEEPCAREGCEMPRGKHRLSWACGGVRVGGSVTKSKGGTDSEDDIQMWQACSVCGKETERTKMHDGTYLFSFAKYLELLIWSPLLTSLSLCEHVTSPSPLSSKEGESPSSGSPFHILRFFAYKGLEVKFTLTPIHDEVYEVRLPRLQIISGSAHKERYSSEGEKNREGEAERQALRAEIDEWWLGIKVRLDKMEMFLEKEEEHALDSKELPPLPSSDDEYSDDEGSNSRPHTLLPKRPTGGRSISFQHATTDSLVSLVSSRSESSPKPSGKPAAPYPPGSPLSIKQSRKLLMKLRASFQRTEDSLQKQAAETPYSSINDVRYAFRSRARGTFKRLAAWQHKHAPSAPIDIPASDAITSGPEWWSGTCHAVPGGRVVVREGEWGSVIAFTLSSLDYQRELLNLNTISGLSSAPSAPLNTHHEIHPVSHTTIIKPANTPAKVPSPDPDEHDTTSWEESEAWTTIITRREHPREATSLLSIRDVLRTRRSFDGSSLGSRFSGSLSRASPTPPLARAQPQVQVNLTAADGQISHLPDAAEIVEEVLESQHLTRHRMEPPLDSDNEFSDSGGATPTPSGFVEKHIRSGGMSTIIPSAGNHSDSHPISIVAPKPQPAIPVHESLAEHDTSGSSFTGAFSSAIRYFLSATPSSRAPSPVQPGAHHGLLALETTPVMDDRPHIKYDWTIGKRLKFSCTVYYAKQFDALRRRCGVDNVVIKSLERSENWTAVGGKSRSNFWKSSDNRFIIKTLVNAWNVADLQVLIELGPSYFRYLDSTASKASALAKLLGFYTVEVKNLETGTIQAKHDLLVMENLFYNQNISKTFDLKGIQTRRVKPNNDGARQTLFDGEWIEGQRRAPLLLQPHSGHILREALRADASFLAKSNIMDYSLLLGIDEERHEVSCGLVDTIGSYTFAKTLEYKAKHNLNSGKGKEVTVVPPAEYHQRFINSMENYFITCPDKWTKPLHYIDRTKPCDLPSIV